MSTPTDISQDDPKMKKPVLLYFYLSDSSFVIQDIASLRIDYTLKLFRFHTKHKFLVPLSFLKQKLFLLRNIFSSSVCRIPFISARRLWKIVSQVLRCSRWWD